MKEQRTKKAISQKIDGSDLNKKKSFSIPQKSVYTEP
jgi:hypothetical protein